MTLKNILQNKEPIQNLKILKVGGLKLHPQPVLNLGKKCILFLTEILFQNFILFLTKHLQNKFFILQEILLSHPFLMLQNFKK